MSLREPPPHARATFGVGGAMGVVVNMVLFVMDIVSDGLLAYVLWEQAHVNEGQWEPLTWFIITMCIILAPMLVINAFSLLWYSQNKQCLGEYSVLHKMGKVATVQRVVMHLLLLGPLVRYMDILQYGLKMRQERKHVEMGVRGGGSILRRTPRGEVYAVLQLVISRDSAMLDMMHSFLQDAPQLIFQVFLLYRRPELITGTLQESPYTTAVQVWKVALGVVAISWSLVTYQEELRRSVPGKGKLNCCASFTCLMWRAAMVASRVMAIGSFAAIYAPEGARTALTVHLREDGSVHMPFPIITACVLAAHWLIMVAWIHAQGTNFCDGETEGHRRPVLEFLYNGVMGLVHVFCYMNLKDTPSRRRMAFFYAFCFAENTAMISVWCVQMEPHLSIWFRAVMVFSVEMLWLVGLCCLIGYYAFLHPDKESLGPPRNMASWRQ
ncbi:XK-related protein 6 [Chionoecetes opilio]|uniref:XK-related protein n=1 Tax=Chionoecetes opilio TaxID=41210 RepID=A0A8J4YB59_CHIOP|nr:XK-related protein 6 [Chionoecetes opilio]